MHSQSAPHQTSYMLWDSAKQQLYHKYCSETAKEADLLQKLAVRSLLGIKYRTRKRESHKQDLLNLCKESTRSLKMLL